ncbi:MAG: hypothetical protein ACE5F1_09665 [Planctomycetota bacterium]
MKLAALFALSFSWLPAQGRGDFLNFETPVVKPLAVARVQGHDYLLVCNTPDSSVEIYDTIGLRLVSRVRVGQEPVSVVYNAALSRFYTANMIGDSVSVVRLSAASATAPLSVQLERTEWVGDEPMMIAFHPNNLTLFVTHQSKGAFSWRWSHDLRPVVPGVTERIDLTDGLLAPSKGLKEPRAIAVRGSTLFVLGFRGGHSFFHDFDLWGLDLTTLRWSWLGGLGTMKANMAFASSGDLFVVGADAQNQVSGRPQLAAIPTGFVRSLLHRVTGAGTGSARIQSRDLNADSSGKPVARSAALAHPMDVVLLEEGGKVQKVFVAAFHSDRVGIIDPRDPDPARWAVRVLDIPSIGRAGMAGPRGLALKSAIPSLANDPGTRLYVLNHIDHSLAVLDPVKERLLKVQALAHDPTPAYIRGGRRFLYSAKLSGSGFVSCASCHIDGRSDGLAWDMSEPPTARPTPLPAELVDGVTDSAILGLKDFPLRKGPMLTQSLQGLVNWEVEGPGQALFSNAPYHWRGDTDFKSFNGAFVLLHGMANQAAPGKPPRGISDAEMAQFEHFVNSISYPPNSEEPLTRVYSGSLGSPDQEDGSGARRGLKLFHTRRLANPMNKQADPTFAGRSCVQCHFLPEGSNNKITRFGLSTKQPIETPSLRGLQQKEARLEKGAQSLSRIVTSEFGLEHQGTVRSINDFVVAVFGHLFLPSERAKLDAITGYMREFDSGVAPMVGFPLTVDLTNATRASTSRALGLFESQAAQSNVGIAVHACFGGKESGFWFLPDARGGLYLEESGTARLDRKSLLARIRWKQDVLVFQCTPLGSDRRIASLGGSARKLTGPAPSGIKLMPMAPNSANAEIPSLTKNWVPGTGPLAFLWSGVYSGTSKKVPEPRSLRSLRILQHGLIQDGKQFGLTRLRHEAPRRFRVAAKNVRAGARLILLVPMDPTTPPPYTTPRPVLPLVIPIYPGNKTSPSGLPVWESAIEVDPTLLYVLMLGGPVAPGVAKAMSNQLAEPPPKGSFKPVLWNKHWVWILNEDGSFASGGWQPLGI